MIKIVPSSDGRCNGIGTGATITLLNRPFALLSTLLLIYFQFFSHHKMTKEKKQEKYKENFS